MEGVFVGRSRRSSTPSAAAMIIFHSSALQVSYRNGLCQCCRMCLRRSSYLVNFQPRIKTLRPPFKTHTGMKRNMFELFSGLLPKNPARAPGTATDITFSHIVFGVW